MRNPSACCCVRTSANSRRLAASVALSGSGGLATTMTKAPPNSLSVCKDRIEHPAAARSPARLVCPDQRRLSQDVAAHGLLKLSLCWCACEVKFLIKGIKLEEIAVATNRGSGAAIASALPVIQPFAGSRWKRSHAFGKACRERRDVEKHPVHPDHSWRSRIRGVGIIDDKGKTLRSRWKARPRKRRRQVLTFASVVNGDLSARPKGGRFDFQHQVMVIGGALFRGGR